MYPQDAYVGNTCDTFVSYTIHLGYILGYTPDSGYIYNTSAIHVSYVLWCIATCTVRITNLTLGSSVSQMYLCAIHVSCMYCDVSSAIRRDTSRYVVLREKVPKSEGKGPPTPERALRCEGPALSVKIGVKGGDITHDCGAHQWTSHAYGVV